MKIKAIKQSLLVIVVALIVSCNSNQSDVNYLPELKVEIPDELADNTEAIEFIKNSTAALNQWSITFEDLVIECEPFIGKTEEELSTMDKLKMGKIIMELMANMGKFTMQVGELEKSASIIADGLNEQEVKAFNLVQESFKNRITELGEKYKDFGKQNSETSSL